MKDLGKAIGAAVGALVVEAIGTIAARIREYRTTPRGPVLATPWERDGHNWQRHKGIPVLCVWCEQELTSRNEFAPCPGPVRRSHGT